MSIRGKMFITCYKDQVKDKGWNHLTVFKKIINMVVTIWRERRKLFHIITGHYIYIRQVELVLTTRCSLRCKECANLMQYYDKPYEIKKETIEAEINNLLKNIDELHTVVLVGGEPFLYRQISDIIHMLSKLEKIKGINIYTNGTIVPTEEMAESLQNKKVKVIISDYGEISKRKTELTQYCSRNKIKFFLKNTDLIWGYVGNMNPRNRSKKQLIVQFRKCNNYCRSILNGRLYYCPRAAHGDDLGYVYTKADEFVDLLKPNVDVEEILGIIYSNNYFSACDYCNYGTKEMIPITPGVQLTQDEKKELFKK